MMMYPQPESDNTGILILILFIAFVGGYFVLAYFADLPPFSSSETPGPAPPEPAPSSSSSSSSSSPSSSSSSPSSSSSSPPPSPSPPPQPSPGPTFDISSEPNCYGEEDANVNACWVSCRNDSRNNNKGYTDRDCGDFCTETCPLGPSCDKDRCNSFLYDWIVENEWYMGLAVDYSECAGCPNRGFTQGGGMYRGWTPEDGWVSYPTAQEVYDHIKHV